jgi:hypothetical protein
MQAEASFENTEVLYYAVLATVSSGYPPPKGTFLFITHPCATLLTPKGFLVRLACVKHAASVRSEPGSNSNVKPSKLGIY